jgi:hypothetical protein
VNISDCRLYSSATGYGIYADDTTTLNELNVSGINIASGNLLSYKYLEYGYVATSSNLITGRSGGTTYYSSFSGSAPTLPKGSESNNVVMSAINWTTWTPVMTNLTIVGALTVSLCVYKRTGNSIIFRLIFSAATSIDCAAGTFILDANGTVPGPSLDEGGAVTVSNSTTRSAIGVGSFQYSAGKLVLCLPAISVTTDGIDVYATTTVA